MHVFIYTLVLLGALAVFAWNLSRRITALRAARSFDARGAVGQRLQGVLQARAGPGTAAARRSQRRADALRHLLGLRLPAAQYAAFPDQRVYLPAARARSCRCSGRGDFLGRAYLYLRDLFDVLVLLAVLYAMYRRLVIKPKRLTQSSEGPADPAADRDADGHRPAAGRPGHERSAGSAAPYSPAELLVGTMLPGAEHSAQVLLHGHLLVAAPPVVPAVSKPAAAVQALPHPDQRAQGLSAQPGRTGRAAQDRLRDRRRSSASAAWSS